MRKCTKCGLNKCDDDFSFKNKNKNIRHSQCKSCVKEQDNKRYFYNINDRKNKIKKRRVNELNKVKEFYNEYKKNQTCSKCGEKRWYVLDFHHIKDNKIMCVSTLVKRGSLIQLKKELEKCVPLCSNCHREQHFFEKNGAVVDVVITLD